MSDTTKPAWGYDEEHESITMDGKRVLKLARWHPSGQRTLRGEEAKIPERHILARQIVDALNSFRDLIATLRQIKDGSEIEGRWLDNETGDAIDGAHDPDDRPEGDVYWEPYTEEEQCSWLSSVAELAGDAIARAEAAQARHVPEKAT